MRENDPQPGLEELARQGALASVRYFGAMGKILRSDSERCAAKCKELRSAFLKQSEGERVRNQSLYSDLDFWYRNLLRAFCSELEGMLFVMRQIVVWAHEREEISLTPAELTLVYERSYKVNVQKKRIEERDGQFNRLLETFVLVFILFPRVFNSNFSVDYSENGWQCLQNVITARNDMVHPKGIGSMVMPARIFQDLPDAMSWFYGTIGEMMRVMLREQRNANDETLGET